MSFREDDGSFRFRLLAPNGEQLLVSRKFSDGKLAGAATKDLQSGKALDIREEGTTFSVWLEGYCIADGPFFEEISSRDAAIAALRAALTPIED